MAGSKGGPSPGKFRDFIMFNQVQHTSNYNPATEPPYVEFLDATLEFPNLVFTTPGNLVSIDSLVITDTGGIRYTIGAVGSQKYWNGSAWVDSNGTYAQANDATTIQTNISGILSFVQSLKTIKVYAYYPSGNLRYEVSGFEFSYTAQLYISGDSSIVPNAILIIEGLYGITETSTKPGISQIKYNFQILNGSRGNLWWNGSAWVTSDGTYAQSNTASEILANIQSFTTDQTWIKIKVIMHSEDPYTTPQITNLNLSYDFAGDVPDDIDIVVVWGYIYDEFDTPIEGSTVKVALIPNITDYKNSTNLINKKFITTTDANGYWNLKICSTVGMETSAYYQFTINKQVFNRKVPNVSEISFYDLPSI